MLEEESGIEANRRMMDTCGTTTRRRGFLARHLALPWEISATAPSPRLDSEILIKEVLIGSCAEPKDSLLQMFANPLALKGIHGWKFPS